MPNDTEVITQENDTETTENTEETTEGTVEAEDPAELRKKIAELTAQKDHWKKKAETKTEAPERDTSEASLSTKDVLALTENKISSEDYDEVVRMAKLLDKPVMEALKDPSVKLILKTRAEERMTALATQTGGGNRGSKSSPDIVLRKAEAGDLPENDSDIEKLAEARMAQRTRT